MTFRVLFGILIDGSGDRKNSGFGRLSKVISFDVYEFEFGLFSWRV